jgi:Aldo/keto reductase family
MFIAIVLIIVAIFAVTAEAFVVQVVPHPRHLVLAGKKSSFQSRTTTTTTALCAESSSSPTRRRDFCQTLAASVLATSTAAAAGTGGGGGLLVPPAHAQEAVVTAAAAATATGTARTIDLPRMGLGAWAWGDSLFWGYDSKNDEELRQVFDFAVQNSKSSKVLLDTAEIYGFGRSETLIGEFAKAYPQDKIQVIKKERFCCHCCCCYLCCCDILTKPRGIFLTPPISIIY